MKTKRITHLALTIALAMVLSFLESQIPAFVAIPGIKMLMSWIPGVIAAGTAVVMALYPITTSKMNQITAELTARRNKE